MNNRCYQIDVCLDKNQRIDLQSVFHKLADRYHHSSRRLYIHNHNLDGFDMFRYIQLDIGLLKA